MKFPFCTTRLNFPSAPAVSQTGPGISPQTGSRMETLLPTYLTVASVLLGRNGILILNFNVLGVFLLQMCTVLVHPVILT